MFIGLHVNYPLFLSDFNETWIFSTKVRKILKYKSLWKFIQCGPSCFMRTVGQTDTRKIIVAFYNFANARTMLFYYRPHTETDYFYNFFSFLSSSGLRVFLYYISKFCAVSLSRARQFTETSSRFFEKHVFVIPSFFSFKAVSEAL
jgi:hypothetical protein